MSINQLHKDITGLLYKVEEDYSRIIQHGEHVPLIEVDIVLKDIRLLYEYFHELKIFTEEQRRRAIPKEKTQEAVAIVAAGQQTEHDAVKAAIEEEQEEHADHADHIDQNNETELPEESIEEEALMSAENEVDAEIVENEEKDVTTKEEITKLSEQEIKPSPIAWQKTFEAPKDPNAKLGSETISPPLVTPKVDLLKEREKDFVPTVRKIEFKKDVDQPEPKKESLFEKAASLYDKIAKPTDKSIAATHSRQAISNIKAAIGINDKFIYLKELFKGNVEEYGAALDKLNDFDSYADAEDYFQELKEKHNWDPDSKPFQGLAELLMRRYL